jgi:hypothetical protein
MAPANHRSFKTHGDFALGWVCRAEKLTRSCAAPSPSAPRVRFSRSQARVLALLATCCRSSWESPPGQRMD